MPKELGCLGIHNLDLLSWALRMKCLWIQKTDPQRPWISFRVSVPSQSSAMFSILVTTEVSNGLSTKFWMDRWIMGKSLKEMAPDVFDMVPKHIAKERTVSQAISNNSWV